MRKFEVNLIANDQTLYTDDVLSTNPGGALTEAVEKNGTKFADLRAVFVICKTE